MWYTSAYSDVCTLTLARAHTHPPPHPKTPALRSDSLNRRPHDGRADQRRTNYVKINLNPKYSKPYSEPYALNPPLQALNRRPYDGRAYSKNTNSKRGNKSSEPHALNPRAELSNP